MPTTISDYQDQLSPMNGRLVRSRADWNDIVAAVRGRDPFVVALDHDGGACLIVGVGGDVSAVQHTDAEGASMVALASGPSLADDDVEFLCGGTATPFHPRWLLTPATTSDLVAHFLATGGRAPTVAWELI